MCAEHVDTIEPYLIECKHVLNFWESIYKWWTDNSGQMFPLYTYETLFGMHNEQEDIVLKQFHYVLLMGNYFVYRKKKAKEEIELYEFLRECKQDLKCKEISMIAAGKEKEFEKTWLSLINFF
jgi:hypothetical protein